jgi:hypothetical protein
LAYDVLSGSTQKALDISSLLFGVSASDSIQTFSQCHIPFKLGTFLPKIFGGPVDINSIVRNLLTNSLLHSGTGSLDSVYIDSVSMEVQPAQTLLLSTSGQFNVSLPFDLSFKSNYLALQSLRIDNQVDLAGVSLSNLNLDTSSRNYFNLPEIKVKFSNNDQVASKLGGIINTYTDLNNPGNSTSILNLQNLAMGVSASDTIKAFQKVKIDLAWHSVLQPTSLWVGRLVNDVISNIPRDVPVFQTVPSANNDGSLSIEVNLGSGLVLDLNDFNIGFRPNKAIGADLKGAIGLPFDKVKASIPFIGIQLGFDAVGAFATTVRGLEITAFNNGFLTTTAAGNRKNALNLQTVSQVLDTDELADKIEGITDALLNARPLPGVFGISGLKIGVSDSDQIEALKEIKLGVGLSKLFQPILDGVKGVGDFKSVLDAFGFGLDKASIDTLPQGRVLFALGARFG